MRKTEAALIPATILAGLLAAAGLAYACMLGAPWELLENRKTALQTAPANSFAWEAEHLAAPVTAIIPPMKRKDADALPDRNAAEQLPPAQMALVTAMRAAPDAATAMALPGDLPQAVRLYTAGAVAFLHDNDAAAAQAFNAVLALPSPQRDQRAVWAAYMLGRLALKRHDAAAAEAAFATARDAAAKGAPDPLFLATASLGDMAKLHLENGEIPAAVALYAAQAAAGSQQGLQSLGIVAQRALVRPDLSALLADPLTQRLLVVTALAQAGDYLNALHDGGIEDAMPYTGFGPPDDLDRAPLHRLGAALAALPAPGQGADRIAALLYTVGDSPHADALAQHTPGPLALWVRAKIAVQRGDVPAAAALYAQALHEAEAGGPSEDLQPDRPALLRGETGTLALTRGDFLGAMAILWPVARTYWGDVVYLAERVLTTSELKAFVDAHVPAKPAGPSHDLEFLYVEPTPGLRDLLSRRLMRDGRYQEALAYTDPPAAGQPDWRTVMRDFMTADAASRTAFWAADRARAGWRAATLLRNDGMEMMGTEMEPDEYAMNGEVEGGFGPDFAHQVWEPGTYVPAEKARVAASQPAPNLRFHYRYLAVDAALRAAAEVPARSQAYAAILCRAAFWMNQTHEPERAAAIYKTYLAHGALVKFAVHFGTAACPEPNFRAMAGSRRKLLLDHAHNIAHRLKWPAGGAALLAVGAVALRRTKRQR